MNNNKYFNDNNNNSGNRGVGFAGLLTILFIALKLTNVIDWSWVWVLSPLWIPFSLAILMLIIIAMFAITTKDK